MRSLPETRLDVRQQHSSGGEKSMQSPLSFQRARFGIFSIFNLFLVWPSLKDTIKRIAKKSTTASPDSFIRESIHGVSSKRDAAPEDASIAMEVIATISKTLSTVSEESWL